MRKLNILARDINILTCQTSGTTGDLLGRWSLLPASILTSEKKTSILQTQLILQNTGGEAASPGTLTPAAAGPREQAFP